MISTSAPMQLLTPKPAGLSVTRGEMWGFTRTRGPRYIAAGAAGLGGGSGTVTSSDAGQTHLAASVPPNSPSLSSHLAQAKKRRPPENAAGLAHNGSRMGRCRRTTGPLLPRRNPKSAFPGKKAELSRTFQCVFSQINKYKGISFSPSSRHSSLNQERSVRSPTSYMMCYTVNNPG